MPVGKHYVKVRYLVYSSLCCLEALGFSAAAWKVKPRNAWIGWSGSQREKNLHLIVNMLFDLTLGAGKNLASKILSLALQKLPENWEKTYGYRPVLLETLVEKDWFCRDLLKGSQLDLGWQHARPGQARSVYGV
ncbi:MAG: Druantia anti-phage system protein DruA [Bacillota bacterium]